MKPIESTLLFVGTPTLALEHFSETLNGRLQFLGIQFEKSSMASDHHAAFSARGMELVVDVKSQALPAESFLGSLDSPLSSPFRGVLSETLFRHNRHMILSIIPETAANCEAPDRLTLLRVAHAATTLLTEWHMPAAVHWRQSNQILVGSQYLQLASDATPWALFAHARIISDASHDASVCKQGVRLDEAIEMIGRPILFHPVGWSLEEVHASALSFLRYAVETGSPIPDGHTYGPEGGHSIKVTYVEPTTEIPLGRYDLSAVDAPEGAFVSQRASAIADRPDDIAVDPPNAYNPDYPAAQTHPEERVRSLGISYMMLLVMPPIGLLLLVSNALFGVNPWRTGVIATASVALALIVGAYTFLSYVGHETAVFIDAQPVAVTILTE
jgi:hypothetical protein